MKNRTRTSETTKSPHVSRWFFHRSLGKSWENLTQTQATRRLLLRSRPTIYRMGAPVRQRQLPNITGGKTMVDARYFTNKHSFTTVGWCSLTTVGCWFITIWLMLVMFANLHHNGTHWIGSTYDLAHFQTNPPSRRSEE